MFVMGMRKTILIFAGLELVLLLVSLWVMDYSGFNIPEKIPGTDISLYACVYLLVLFILSFIFQKRILRIQPGTSLFNLILWSVSFSVIAGVVYQGIRHFVLLHNTVSPFLISCTVNLFAAAAVSLPIALDLKKFHRLWNILATLVILLVLGIFYKMFPVLEL
jgi:hypothetical protein